MVKGILEVHAYSAEPLPSSVSVTSEVATNTPHQRKIFYANGLHWVFFQRQSYIQYKVSSDGLVWSSPISVTFSFYADFFSLYFDGVYVHYVCNSMSNIWYRKGIPNSDGTITWLTGEQIIPEFVGEYCCDGTICVDANGCPWIGYYDASDISHWVPGIIKSKRNDGVWETALGFPYVLSERTYRGVGVIPLTAGKVYALYYRAFKKLQMDAPTQPIYGKLWDGFSWGNEERVSISNVANEEFHMLSFLRKNDDVHVVFLKDLTNEIVHVKRTLGSWQPETVVAQVSSLSVPQISYNPLSDTFYCFWASNNRVYFKKLVDDVWDELPIEWVYEDKPIAIPGYTPSYYLLSSPKITSSLEGSKIGVAWLLLDGKDQPIHEDCKALLRYNHLKLIGA